MRVEDLIGLARQASESKPTPSLQELQSAIDHVIGEAVKNMESYGVGSSLFMRSDTLRDLLLEEQSLRERLAMSNQVTELVLELRPMLAKLESVALREASELLSADTDDDADQKRRQLISLSEQTRQFLSTCNYAVRPRSTGFAQEMAQGMCAPVPSAGYLR